MNEYEVYCFYSALRLHFTKEDYDFFENKGRIRRRTPEGYLKKTKDPERLRFKKIAELAQPRLFLVGNFLFNSSTFIGDFTSEHYLSFKKYRMNGEYIFKEHLKCLKGSFKKNISGEIPKVVSLYLDEEIDLFFISVIHHITGFLNAHKESFFIGDLSKKIIKKTGFMKVDVDTYRRFVIEHFSGR